MRHSCSHLTAAAVQQLWPRAKFSVGPAVDNGFLLRDGATRDTQPEDLENIELAMRQLKNKKVPFERMELATDEAIALMEKLGQRYKELPGLLKEKGSTAVGKDIGDDDAVGVAEGAGGVPTVSLRKTGDFVSGRSGGRA